MNKVLRITKDEIRYWRRSQLAWLVLLALLATSVVAATVSNFESEGRAEQRSLQQAEADAIFQAQPDRHPHRMVHYGHYVYRPASPLAAIDPGIDSMVGTSIFLEGHRRNSATFAAAKETGLLARFGSFSPAFVLQTIMPLLLIVCGFSALTREKESRTLYQLIGHGVSGRTIVLGKFIALSGLGVVALLPLLVLGLIARDSSQFAALPSLLALGAGYLVYLAFWAALTVGVSALLRSSALSLSVLLAVWLVAVVITPRVASEVALVAVPPPSKVETDLAIAETLRAGGDSHDVEDAAFNDLRSVTLAEYDVESIEELPFNYRGLVALRGEEADTKVLSDLAEAQFEQELAQKKLLEGFSVLSPVIALRSFSMSLAGTALQDHHHFLRSAEDYRFDMVQTFNRLQMSQMSLAEDLARNDSEAAAQRTKVSADTWQEMPVFELQPLTFAERFAAAAGVAVTLLLWLLASASLLLFSTRRLLS